MAINYTGTSKRTEYSYDPMGRRSRIVEKNGEAVLSDKRFVWSGLEICEERDSSNNVTRRFYPQGEQIAGQSYYYTRDHLGSVREMTDDGGTVRARYDYDLWGVRSANLIASNPVESEFGYTGHYFHGPSGLHLAPYRAYDAQIGRWISRDPIGEQGGLNLYRYVVNSPVNISDPLGLVPVMNTPNGPVSYQTLSTPNSPYTFADIPFNGPVSGLLNYMFGDGRDVPLGPDLLDALQNLQRKNPWSETDCHTNMSLDEYGSFDSLSDILDTLNVGLSLGQFRYTNDGTTTSISDRYAFPISQSDHMGGMTYHNALLSGIPGTPYNVTGVYPTPR